MNVVWKGCEFVMVVGRHTYTGCILHSRKFESISKRQNGPPVSPHIDIVLWTRWERGQIPLRIGFFEKRSRNSSLISNNFFLNFSGRPCIGQLVKSSICCGRYCSACCFNLCRHTQNEQLEKVMRHWNLFIVGSVRVVALPVQQRRQFTFFTLRYPLPVDVCVFACI